MECALTWSQDAKLKLPYVGLSHSGETKGSASPEFGETRPPTEFELIFDASPWGLGGVLTTAKSSIALHFFHEPLTAEDFARFNVQAGDAKGQQYWEALSVLVGLKLWAPLVAKSSAIVQVKSDSVTALQCTAKLASFEWDWSGNCLGTRVV